jgi:hypothetical protein
LNEGLPSAPSATISPSDHPVDLLPGKLILRRGKRRSEIWTRRGQPTLSPSMKASTR